MTEPATPPAAAPRAPSGSFGRLAFGFLAVAAVSGAALAPFASATDPLDGVERLEGGVPWGFLLRGLHAYASFGLLVSLAAHLVQVIAARTERQLPAGVWWRSVSLLPLTVAALLSGFVLRGDAEAAAALAVFRRIAETLPVLGPELARLLTGTTPGDLGASALHHAGTFTLLLWILTAEHGGRLLPDARSTVLAGLVSTALAGAAPLPLGPPPGAPARLLLGPWYLLGLQGALVDIPTAAGWLAPLLLVLLLGSLRHVDGAARRAVVAAVAAWAIAYTAFTVRLLLFRG